MLFWGLSLFMPREKVDKGDFWKIAAASVVGLFVPQMTFLVAITMSSSIDTGIIGTLGPIFTMIFAFLFVKEPITGKKAGGVALSFEGVMYLILNSVHSGGAEASSPQQHQFLVISGPLPAADIEVQRGDVHEMDVPGVAAAVAAVLG